MKYFIGIDLGTTNTSVSYVQESDWIIHTYEIQQMVSEGLVAARKILPSAIYFPVEGEIEKDSIPEWISTKKAIVGEFARKQQQRAGHRCVVSAKSWLCHSASDCKGAILPWKSSLAEKISAFEATRMILSHIRDSWNHDVFGGKLSGKFEEQQIVITVPASFDPAARDYTLEAALECGFENVKLLEEPQAAFYAWIYQNQDTWKKSLKIGERILVCDVGGGTTDFSLIEAADQAGNLELRRISVGNHILLGGDNMDLAIQHFLMQKLKEQGISLNPDQIPSLIAQARDAKEKILGEDLESVQIVIAGTGSSLFKSSAKISLLREEVHKLVVEGFFAHCEPGEKPKKPKLSGFRELGLDYAYDPLILRHLSGFLSQGGEMVFVQKILFNGSMFCSALLRQKVLDGICLWAEQNKKDAPCELFGVDYELSVSCGAAYYAGVCSGKGIRIRASLPYSYYVGVEKSQMAIPGFIPPPSLLCVAPFGMEEGSRSETLPDEFYLVVGEEVEFRLFRSSSRKDSCGYTCELEEGIEEVTALQKKLECIEGSEKEYIPVRLETYLNELGTLEVWCRSQKSSWKLEFQVREDE